MGSCQLFSGITYAVAPEWEDRKDFEWGGVSRCCRRCEGAVSISYILTRTAEKLPPPSHVCLLKDRQTREKQALFGMYSTRVAFLEITLPGADMNIHQSVLGTGASLHAMYTNPAKCIPGKLPG